MTMFQEVVKVIYETAQILGGIIGIGVFALVLKEVGFSTSRVSGNTTTVGIGFGFLLALFLAALSILPLFFFESEYKLPGLNFPNHNFQQKFWIFFFCELFVCIIWIITNKRRIRLSVFYVLLAMIGASWSGKTAELISVVIYDYPFSIFIKVIYVVLGVIYVAIYFLMPLLLINFIHSLLSDYKYSKAKPSFEILRNADKNGRIAALKNLTATISASWIIDPFPILEKLHDCCLDERDFDVRQQIKKLLGSKKTNLAIPEYIYWTAFNEDPNIETEMICTSKPVFEKLPVEVNKLYYDDNGYNIDQDSEDWIWANFCFEKQLPDNFDFEIITNWKSGQDNIPYGALLGVDNKSFIAFCIAKSGHAMVGFFQSGTYKQALIPWKKMDVIKTSKNKIRIEARQNYLNYYVNGVKVDTIKNESFQYFTCGPIVGKKQSVCFSLLNIYTKKM